MINKEQLLLKLKNDNININEKELNIIIFIYNRIMDFVCEMDQSIPNNIYFRYKFINSDDSLDSEYTDDLYDIFKNIITIRNNNLLFCLDYALLIQEGSILSNSKEKDTIGTLSDYTNYIINNYKTCKEDFFGLFITTNNDAISIALYDLDDKWVSYKCIPKNYRRVMKAFDRALEVYYDDEDDITEAEDEMYFDYVLSMVYYYLLINNLIESDTEKVISFIKYLTNNMEVIVEKITLSGIKTYQEMFDYIDTLYRNAKKKIKEIE